jgi:hypothetical protein
MKHLYQERVFTYVATTTKRLKHIQTIEQQGCMAWQRETGYNLRSLVELSIQRYKRIFSNIMKASKLPESYEISLPELNNKVEELTIKVH